MTCPTGPNSIREIKIKANVISNHKTEAETKDAKKKDYPSTKTDTKSLQSKRERQTKKANPRTNPFSECPQ